MWLNRIRTRVSMANIGRGLLAIVIAWQVIGLLPVLTWIGKFDQVSDDAYARVFVKIVVLLLLAPLFIRLGRRVARDSSPIAPSEQSSAPAPFRLSAIHIVGIGFWLVVVVLGLAARFGSDPLQVETSAPNSGAFNPNDLLIPEKKQLGFVDQWRYDSCITDAAKNPTTHGVNTASAVCRRRFDQ